MDWVDHEQRELNPSLCPWSAPDAPCAGVLEPGGTMARQTHDPRKALNRLEAVHRDLKQRVAYLERRAFLTPGEQSEANALKKRKLATKDAMAELRAQIAS